MGKLLQIRVSAATWDEAEVLKRWPALCKLAWPDSLDPMPGFSPPPHGVTELASALREGLRFGNWQEKLIEAVKAEIQAIATAQDGLEKALSDWDARTANRFSEELESALDKAESKAWPSSGLR